MSGMSETENGRKRARKWTRVQAERELVAWRSSGKTLSAYGRERGYSANRLSNWLVRLRSKTATDIWRPPQPGDEAALLPVRVVSSSSAHGASSSEGSSPIEVELRNGVRVRLLPGFDAGTFERVLAVVSRC